MILVIDNFDSFTYNIVQYLGEITKGKKKIKVVRNNAVQLDQINELKPERILISPGPCTPNEAGVSLSIYERFAPRLPILGVCLGHQCLGQAFGGKVIQAGRMMHGKTSPIYHDGKGVFKGLKNPFTATRYHSLLVERKSLPEALCISAETKEKEIMGLRHKKYPWVEGVQFHPESILTENGRELLANFLAFKKP
jgi:para-aminobenzoate synthetase component II